MENIEHMTFLKKWKVSIKNPLEDTANEEKLKSATGLHARENLFLVTAGRRVDLGKSRQKNREYINVLT